MSKDMPIQYGFLAGEITPKMNTRWDVEDRAFGAHEMTNWFPRLQGPAETVPGFQYIFGLEAYRGRIFPFSIATFSGFIIAVTTAQVVVTDSLGPTNSDNQFVDGDFMLRSPSWATAAIGAAEVNFTSGACIMISGDIPADYADLAQTATVIASQPNTLAFSFVAGEGEYTIFVSSTPGGGPDIFEGTFIGPGPAVIPGLISPTTDMYVTLRVLGTLGTQVRIIDKAVLANEFSSIPVTWPSPWGTNEDINTIQVAQPPGEKTLIFSSAHTAPHTLTWTPETDTWSFAPIAFEAQPPEWADFNWPVAVEFFEGRMYLGGTDLQPETFWASESGNFLNMYLAPDPEEEPLPSDPLSHRLERHGKIRWMKGLKRLLIGTENAEYLVDSEGGVIVPGDISARRQSANGSITMQAVEVGNKVLYVSPDGRKVRAVGYEWAKESWVSHDVTFGAEHITEGANVIQHLAWALNPRNTLVSVTANGNMMGATYNPLNDGAGFFRRKTDGRIVSVCSLPSGGIDELWVLVNRQGVESVYVEKVRAFRNVMMDSYHEFQFTTPTSTVTVIHLAGRTCRIIADNKIHPDRVATGGGVINLNYPASHIIVGLEIENRLETLSRNDGMSTGQLSSGSSAGADKRWSKIYASVSNSDVPLINDQRPPSAPRLGPEGEIPDPVTNAYHVALRGIDMKAQVVFSQDRSLPVTLNAFFGELEQN